MWTDTLYCSHMMQMGMCWVHYDEEETWDLVENVSVGMVLFINDEKIVMTMTRNLKEEGYCDTPTIIPLGCVKELYKLTEDA